MWVLKKVFSRVFFPIPLCLEVLTLGFLLLCFTRKQKTGKALVGLAGVLLFVFSSHFFSHVLIEPLEERYPSPFISFGAPVPDAVKQAKFVVVLGSVINPDAQRPVEVDLGSEAVARLVEAVRVSKMLHCCKLVLSGVPAADGFPATSQIMGEIAEELGVSGQDMILETHSSDTEEEAQLIAPIVGQAPFILVTEASHMPRAMALFRKQGTHPIADPTDFRTSPDESMGLPELIPDAEDLRGSERAVYEYLGLAWAKVRGKI